MVSKLETKIESLLTHEKKLKRDVESQNQVAREALKTVEKLAEKFDKEKLS